MKIGTDMNRRVNPATRRHDAGIGGPAAVCRLALCLVVGWIVGAASADPVDRVDWLARSGFERPENLAQFKRLAMRDRIVYRRIRRIGRAVVQRDFVAYHFDRRGRLLDFRLHWRDDLPDRLPPVIDRARLSKILRRPIRYAGLFYLAPGCRVTPVEPCPTNPCWIVETEHDGHVDGLVVDAVDGHILGPAVPPPAEAVSFTGPIDLPNCAQTWSGWYRSAATWFDHLGYATDQLQYPDQDTLRAILQSDQTVLLYEIAHGGSVSFSNACNDATSATEIETWLANAPKLPFAFIASCGGMCSTGPGTLSHAFRKGSNQGTATVGYCGMADDPCKDDCWYAGYTIAWQERMFEALSQGETVGRAFELANLDYPGCATGDCFRLAGDPDLVLVPKIGRHHGAVIYVDASATGAGTGTSWTHAYPELRNALAVADREARILVAQGVYRPAPPGGPRMASFILPPGATILGGFPPGGGPDNARDPNQFPTILSGDLNGDDDPNNIARTDNAYHVVLILDDGATTLDGLTITGGNADAPYQVDTSGFARAGAGVVVAAGRPTFVDCRFVDNAARSGQAGRAGAVYVAHGAQAVFQRCIFEHNIADVGGAVYGPADATDCLFAANQARLTGGALQWVSPVPVHIEACQFLDNRSGRDGGAVYVIDAGPGPRFTGCVFEGNRAEHAGGALHVDETSTEIIRSRFISNHAARGGAVSLVGDGETTMQATVLAANTADDAGGAMAIQSAQVTVHNCTFADHVAPMGAAIHIAAGANVDVLNAILWNPPDDDHDDRPAPIRLEPGATLHIAYTDIHPARTAVDADPDAALDWGPGNIDVDPLFVAPDQADFHLRSAGGRRDPTSGQWIYDTVTSRCIDAGHPAMISDVEPYVFGTRVPNRINMGAYGDTGEAAAPFHNWSLRADLTNDGTVNLEDLAWLAVDWLGSIPQPPADVQPDGLVDIRDLRIFVADWLRTTDWR